jgi:hypothetical protein
MYRKDLKVQIHGVPRYLKKLRLVNFYVPCRNLGRYSNKADYKASLQCVDVQIHLGNAVPKFSREMHPLGKDTYAKLPCLSTPKPFEVL